MTTQVSIFASMAAHFAFEHMTNAATYNDNLEVTTGEWESLMYLTETFHMITPKHFGDTPTFAFLYDVAGAETAEQMDKMGIVHIGCGTLSVRQATPAEIQALKEFVAEATRNWSHAQEPQDTLEVA